jgi:hypothetical protein
MESSSMPSVCPSCGTQIASERPSVMELAANICCLVLLAAVLFPAGCEIAIYVDHVVRDLPVHIRSPELVDRWNL